MSMELSKSIAIAEQLPHRNFVKSVLSHSKNKCAYGSKKMNFRRLLKSSYANKKDMFEMDKLNTTKKEYMTM